MATKYNDVSLGDQLSWYGMKFQHFRDGFQNIGNSFHTDMADHPRRLNRLLHLQISIFAMRSDFL
jgi:hypothetical protein